MRRPPAVAGTFYPKDPSTLERDVRSLLAEPVAGVSASRTGPEPARAVAVLAPHAGYIYSGPCAGATYREVRVPDRAIVLCPNHTGLGRPLALMAEGEWETPVGAVPIDEALARRLLDLDPELVDDALAHAREHALEVQLPFLKLLNPGLRIVPICVGTNRLDSLLALGDAIASAIRGAGDVAVRGMTGPSPVATHRDQAASDQVLVVVSSDMSHYVPFEEARARDAMAIERMEELDAEGLHAVVEREEISMCGAMPAVAGLRAARALGASRGRLVAYTSSGDRTGDYREVVAYAGMVFH